LKVEAALKKEKEKVIYYRHTFFKI